MSYRNPRFSVAHAALDAGSGSVTLNGGTADPNTSIERLHDLRSKALYRVTPASGTAIIELDQGTVQRHRPNYNRLLIPEGHNLATRRARMRLESSADAATAWTQLNRSDGVPTSQEHARPFVHDQEIAETALRGLRLAGTQIGAGDVELGELWWTCTVQPTTGIVPRWQQDQEPNVLRSVTTGGESFNLERGPARRVYDLEHRHISGADLALYEDLVRVVGVSGRPFWYEHPDSGDAAIVKQAFGSAAQWTVSNGSASDLTGTGWDAGDAVAMSATGAGAVQARYTFAAEFDLRNHYASIDVRIPTSAAWLTVATDLRLLLVSRQTDLGSELEWAFWNLGNHILDMTTPIDTWWRIYLDLDSPDGQNNAAGYGLDLGRVDRVIVDHDATAGAQVVQWDNFQVYDREKQPRLVELLSFDKSMDSRSPKSGEGPTYTVRMQMIEVLA